MTVKAEDLLDELHIDQTDVELKVMQGLIDQSQELVMSSVDHSQLLPAYQAQPLFDPAVKAIATQLYYDRDLSTGLSKGAMMLLSHLSGRMVVTNVTGGDNDG